MNASPEHAELMAALSAPRLADPTPAEFWQTALAAFSLGILAMILLVALLALVSRRRDAPFAASLARLDAARALQPERRLLVQAQVLRELSAKRPRPALAALAREIGAALYAPAPTLDPDATDAAIRAALRRG
ncbi:hypothetical protein [Antarcticirhabdus aurantiaca]|uniref:Uncharacterized protein n=1 Tax=Antarcticirhabdus aurantiaca TaxID=2606717 RepID=A0ACD4NJE6_9HYPH|nr:hypothetical protein [Antarcticirhabdus aurantiaca]WAJ26982.1 hypothetical protein OXU80_19235 [Jeongeuplla avenae]